MEMTDEAPRLGCGVAGEGVINRSSRGERDLVRSVDRKLRERGVRRGLERGIDRCHQRRWKRRRYRGTRRRGDLRSARPSFTLPGARKRQNEAEDDHAGARPDRARDALRICVKVARGDNPKRLHAWGRVLPA
jgi:hypothetical protein